MKMTKRIAAILFCLANIVIGIFMLASCGECEHEWGEWTVTKSATCSAEGERIRFCKLDASHSETESIPTEAHAFNKYVSDGNVTCTTDGTETAFCENKGCNAKDTRILASQGQHQFVNYTTVSATCTKNSYKIAECKKENCSATHIVEDEGTALGHSYGDDRICKNCEEAQAIAGEWDVSLDKDSGDSVLATLYVNSENDYELAISGTGAMADFESGKTPWNGSGKAIRSITVSDGVTAIGANAFNNLSNVKAVALASGIEVIGEAAFNGCYSIKGITLPSTVCEIGASAFSGCSGIVEFVLPSDCAISEIKASTFSGCSQLSAIVIPDTVKTIGESAFKKNSTLSSVSIPESVVVIGAGAFEGCKALEEVRFDIDGSLETISDNAFLDCEMLAELQLPKALTLVGNNAFEGCAALTTLTFASDDNLAYIGTNAFDGCDALVYNETDTALFLGTNDNPSAFLIKALENATTVTVDATTKVIAGGAFADATELESITLPFLGSSIKENEDTFAYIFGSVPASLKNVVFTGEIKIVDNAFAGCDSIETIEFKEAVISIGNNAFDGCDSLNFTEYAGAAYIGYSANPYAFLVKVLASSTSVSVHKDTAVICPGAFAECGDIKSLTVDAGNATFIAKGNSIIDVAAKALIAGTAKSVIPTDGSVTVIADGAFKNCSGLKTIVIPSAIVEIGKFAFAGCSSLTSATLPATVTKIGLGAFEGCSSIETITIPFVGESADSEINTHFGFIFSATASVEDSTVPASLENVILLSCETISAEAFKNCDSIVNIYLPETLKFIGTSAFDGCNALKTVRIKDVSAWCAIEFEDITANPLTVAHNLYVNSAYVSNLIIPSTVTSVGFAAFAGASGLISITLPSSVTSIGADAFAGCDALTTVSIPAISAAEGEDDLFFGQFFGVDENGAYAIPKNLKSVVISGGEKIGRKMFENCSIIESIFISSSVKSIGESAFAGCTALKELVIEDIASWCKIDFENINANPLTFAHNLVINGTVVTELVIPANAETVKDYAFSGCSSIESITVEDGISSIGRFAFINCTALDSVVLSDSVSSIGEYAFSGCHSLKDVVLSKGLTSVEPFTFAGCANISKLHFDAKVAAIDATAFVGCNSLEFISVSDDNENYCALDGILYNKVDSTITYVPIALKGDVTLLDGLSSVNAGVFTYFPYVYSIVVPESVTVIEAGAFAGFINLRSISIPFVGAYADDTDANDAQTKFGYIFGTVPTTLTSVTVTGDASINAYAFENCAGIQTVTISGEVNTIGRAAFNGCEGLITLILNSSVSKIEKDAFYGCRKLDTVYYFAESEDWDEIKIGENNASLTASKVLFYSEEMPETVGTHWHYNEEGKITVW